MEAVVGPPPTGVRPRTTPGTTPGRLSRLLSSPTPPRSPTPTSPPNSTPRARSTRSPASGSATPPATARADPRPADPSRLRGKRLSRVRLPDLQLRLRRLHLDRRHPPGRQLHRGLRHDPQRDLARADLRPQARPRAARPRLRPQPVRRGTDDGSDLRLGRAPLPARHRSLADHPGDLRRHLVLLPRP